MRCPNCNNEIRDNEVFCDYCKKELKRDSSKKKLDELENLIVENKELNELEITKEIINLNDLKDENSIVKEPTREDINKDLEFSREELNSNLDLTREELNKDFIDSELDESMNEKKSKKKKKIIIIIIILVLLLSVPLVYFIVLKSKPHNPEKENINYKEVIKSYGDVVYKSVQAYLTDNEEIPSWQLIEDLITYDKYEVVCEVHNIYKDGNVYLNKCFVNDKKVNYSYGKEQEEVKEGMKISVYKNGDEYTNSDSGGTLVGTITCKSELCKYITSFDKYVIVEEKENYYLYNYETNTLDFGPYNYNTSTIIEYNKKIYGIYYVEGAQNNIYSTISNKTFKDIKGTIQTSENGTNLFLICKYGYIMFKNGSTNDFINLKTGNISFKVPSPIKSYIEDSKNNILYFLTYNSSTNKYKVYNSNGKNLFDGAGVDQFILGDNKLFISDNNKFMVYNNKINLIYSSKVYNQIFYMYDSFVVVLDEGYLKIVDMNGSVLATLDRKWDSAKYSFYPDLSGIIKENSEETIYLIIKNSDIPYGNKGSGLKFYYILSTHESGVIETTGIN